MTNRQIVWTERIVLAGLLLAGMALFSGCGQTCKQQYNTANYSYGAAIQAGCDLYEANVIGDGAFVEFAEIAIAANPVRLRLKSLAENNACHTLEWRESLALLQAALRELQTRNQDNLQRLQTAYRAGTLRGMSDEMIIRLIDLILELLIRWPVLNDEIDLATEQWVSQQYERMKTLLTEIK